MFGQNKKPVKTMVLSREDILSKQDVVTEEVYVPVWDGWVCVKSLTGKERDNFERNIVEMKGSGRKTKTEVKENVRARLVARTVVDPETLEPVFKSADIEALGDKNASALDTIFEVAQRLSKLSDDDVDELVKNSESSQGDDSTSD